MYFLMSIKQPLIGLINLREKDEGGTMKVVVVVGAW